MKHFLMVLVAILLAMALSMPAIAEAENNLLYEALQQLSPECWLEVDLDFDCQNEIISFSGWDHSGITAVILDQENGNLIVSDEIILPMSSYLGLLNGEC